MAEEQRQTNVHDDLDDLFKEVAGADLPGYQQADEMAGMTAAQKKRRMKKNKKKEMKQMMAGEGAT